MVETYLGFEDMKIYCQVKVVHTHMHTRMALRSARLPIHELVLLP